MIQWRLTSSNRGPGPTVLRGRSAASAVCFDFSHHRLRMRALAPRIAGTQFVLHAAGGCRGWLWPLWSLALAALLAGCALPPLAGRSESAALPVAQAVQTALGRAISSRVAAHPGLAGIRALPDPLEAFASRMLLAAAAERTLDLQYYIWHADRTGTLLMGAVLAAADRGVRVRLLIDDNNTSGEDAALAALAAHRHIEVRLFNPFVVRRPRVFGYLTRFSTQNRRMHNKSFTADNEATIVGGRNIGDEYFGATDQVAFTDLDVLAVGDVVRTVSSDFDRYWRSASAYPAQRIVAPLAPEQRDALAAAAARIEEEPQSAAYMKAVEGTPYLRDLMRGELDLEWAATELVSDDPAKGLGRGAPDDSVATELKQIFGDPRDSLALISPYFVPSPGAVDALSRFARQGVAVRILTNSLESTDVLAVQAGYAPHRKALLRAGVSLFEMRRSSGARARASGAGRFGSSSASLHAKTFAVDRQRAFVGSFNFDPRSAELNTEMGLVIDSPTLAGQIDEAFETEIPLDAYQVELDDAGNLVWIERDGQRSIRHTTEPGATLLKRASLFLLSLLPIDGLL